MAASIESTASLLREAAPAAGLATLVQHGEAGEWDIVFQDGRIVEATLIAETGLLVLETSLGVPASSDPASLHKALLEYNYLWRETGGLRIALDAPQAGAVLAYDLPAEGPDSTLLANVLGNFHAAATAWAERLAQADPVRFDPMATTGLIRA